MKQLFSLLIAFLVCSVVTGQFTESRIKLPSELNEISGLELVNDTLLIAHNDSGNLPLIYFLSLNGSILHTCSIQNAVNMDWEDMTLDHYGHIYIADCGNNLNSRKDLKILKVNWKDALLKESVEAEIISYIYEDQQFFPPAKNSFDFDCEAIFWKSDSLFLVTKSGSKPWKGIANIYSLNTFEGSQTAQKYDSVFIGNNGWMKDAITSADSEGKSVFMLTYNSIITYSRSNNFQLMKRERFKKYNQKEAIAILGKEEYFVASERNWLLGGPYLYKITRK